MSRQRQITLVPPVGGIDRAAGYQHQKPYTCFDAQNVRGLDVSKGRQRIGSRPGISKAYAQDLGGPIRLLDTITTVSSGEVKTRTVAIAAGNVWYENDSGVMIKQTTAGDGLSTTNTIYGAEYLQKYYIIDGTSSKVFDPAQAVDSSVTTWAASAGDYGTLPASCTSIAVYRDRVVLANGHQWYMSRAGDAHDWKYSEDGTDYARACSGSNTQAGLIGQPVQAITSHGDNCCLFFGISSTYIMRGDPVAGGMIQPLSIGVGAVCQGAVSVAPGIRQGKPEGHFFLSRDGLYFAPASCGSLPVSISRERMPQELINLDTTLADGIKVNMQYDPASRGLHIFLTADDPAAATEHWYYDNDTGAFWKDKFGAISLQPYSVTSYTAASGDKLLLMGGNDGYIRKFDPTADDDDGTAITSYVDMGPIHLGNGMFNGTVAQMVGITSSATTTVDWELTTADTAQEATTHAVTSRKASGSWGTGRNSPVHKAGRGEAAMLKVSADNDNEDDQWGLEGVILTVSNGGRIR